MQFVAFCWDFSFAWFSHIRHFVWWHFYRLGSKCTRAKKNNGTITHPWNRALFTAFGELADLVHDCGVIFPREVNADPSTRCSVLLNCTPLVILTLLEESSLFLNRSPIKVPSLHFALFNYINMKKTLPGMLSIKLYMC